MPVRSVSESKKKIIETQVSEMLIDGIISQSHSKYGSAVILLPKKNGEKGCCVDYRKLNAMKISERTKIPIISDTLPDLGDAKIFSTIDLKPE